jgi:hypothetical protein
MTTTGKNEEEITKKRRESMAHFRGWLQGNRGATSRLGGKQSGIRVSTNGWNLGVEVTGYFDKEKDTDVFTVVLTGGSNGHFPGFEIGHYSQVDLEKLRGEEKK